MSAEPTFESTDALAADDRHRPAKPINPVFLVACPGSGTEVLATVLAAHPDVRAVEASDRLTAEHATESTTQWLRGWAAEQQDGAALLLAHEPRNGLRVPFLTTVFPEAKFVHLVRDGRDVARTLELEAGESDVPAPEARRSRESLEGVSGYLRCALAWREVVEATLSDLEGVTHVLVRYEDLLERPAETAERLLSYLDLEQHAEQDSAFARAAEIAQALPNGEHYAVRRWRAVARKRPLELRAANVLIADVLERLGYDPAPPEVVGAGGLQLPRWALLEQRRLARMVEERDRQIADLQQTAADLRRSNLSEREVGDAAKARVRDLTKQIVAEREELEARIAELTDQLEQTERVQGQRGRERDLADTELERLRDELDEAAAAIRRTARSRSWRFGHRLARAVRMLLGRAPGRSSALDVTLDRIERARARADAAARSRRDQPPGPAA